MKSGNILLAFAFVVISIFTALTPVLADNSMIPSSLISYRDQYFKNARTFSSMLNG